VDGFFEELSKSSTNEIGARSVTRKVIAEQLGSSVKCEAALLRRVSPAYMVSLLFGRISPQ